MGGRSSKQGALLVEGQSEINDLAEDAENMRRMLAVYVTSLQATMAAQKELSSSFTAFFESNAPPEKAEAWTVPLRQMEESMQGADGECIIQPLQAIINELSSFREV